MHKFYQTSQRKTVNTDKTKRAVGLITTLPITVGTDEIFMSGLIPLLSANLGISGGQLSA